MKSILAVLLLVGLASAAVVIPSRGTITVIFKDLQQKLAADVKQVVGHAKEDYQIAVEHVKEASQAVSSKAPKETLQLVKQHLKESIQKIAAEGKDDTHAIVEHLKEAYAALKSAMRPQTARILFRQKA